MRRFTCRRVGAAALLGLGGLAACSSSEVAPRADASPVASADAAARTSGTPGAKVIEFPASIKIHNGMPLALSLEPTLPSKALTESDIAALPPIVSANAVDGSACKAGAENVDGLGELRSLGLMRVGELVIEMEAEMTDPNSSLLSFARLCIGVRDGAGKWHWELRPVNAGGGTRPGDSRHLITGTFQSPIDEPIDAVKIVIEQNEVVRKVYRVRYEVLAP
jgi:hypothetical protein